LDLRFDYKQKINKHDKKKNIFMPVFFLTSLVSELLKLKEMCKELIKDCNDNIKLRYMLETQ